MMKNLKNSSNHFSNDNMKKLAIFDFDGTLFDSIDDVVVCFNKVLTIYGFPTLTRDEYIPCLGGNIDDIVSKVLGDNNTPQNLEKVKKTALSNFLWVVVLNCDFFVQDIAFVPSYSHVS